MSKPGKPHELFIGEHFDSRLIYGDTHEGGNIILQLLLRAYYHPVKVRTGPPSGYFQEEDDRYGIDKHESMIWNQWKTEFKTVIEEFWQDRYWLRTPEDYPFFVKNNARLNIRCAVKVEMLPFPGGAHQTFNIKRVGDYRINRAHAGGFGYTGWRSDVGYEPMFEPKPLFIDEVDHIYVLPHKVRGNSNFNKYFAPESPFLDDDIVNMKTRQLSLDAPLFGARNERSAWHAHPWQLAIKEHTAIPSEKWKVSTVPLYPEKIQSKEDKDKKEKDKKSK